MTKPFPQGEAPLPLSVTTSDLDELFRQAPSFFAVLRGPQYVFERVNEAYLQLIGHRDVIGKPVFEALPDAAGQGLEKLLDDVYQTGKPFVARALPVSLARKLGAPAETVYIDFTYQPLRTASGEVIGIIAHGADVTEQVVARREAEERALKLAEMLEETGRISAELELSNDQLQEINLEVEEARDQSEGASRRLTAVLASLSDSVSVLDEQFRWTYINPASADLLRKLGRKPDQLLGRVLWDEFPDLEGGAFEKAARRALSAMETVEHEEFVEALNCWFETRFVPHENGITIFSRDVTEKRHSEKELRANEEQFRTTLNAIPTLAWMAHADGWLFWYNNKWYEYTGTGPDDMVGWGWQSVHDPDILPSVLERWKASIATGAPFEMEFPLRSATGEFRWFLTRVSPLRDSQGRIKNWVGTNTDVHLQREATEAARAANQAKTDFLAAMSHETRQPINATLGFLEVMEMGMYGELTTKQTDALARIRANQEQLLTVITDILSFARLDAGKVRLQQDVMSCSVILTGLPALVESQISARGLRLVVEPGGADACLVGDRNRIFQILTNLVTNSIRATASGGLITVRCLPQQEWVSFQVEDTGSGIPSDKLEQIFSPFVQLDRSFNQPREGVGLGLAISRDLALGMGGTLTTTSEIGKGSTFTLKMPAAPKG
ncbi:MAG: PAS domain-containing protein [Gemmatimonadaceae bacterium]|nr:PAS domain-containing protein [Gemmatimonadaceae bacterium]